MSMSKSKRGLLPVMLSVLIAVTAGIFLKPVPAGAATASQTIKVKVTYDQSAARSMLADINAFRANEGTSSGDQAWYYSEDNTNKVALTGLKPLSYDYGLEAVAMQRAAEIAVRYSHSRPNGSDWSTALSEMGVSWSSIAENIAYGSSLSADRAFVLWREDNQNYGGQGHRRNMLNRGYTHIGIGHAISNGMHFWVQEFNAGPSGISGASDGEQWVDIDISGISPACSNVTVTPAEISGTEGNTVSAPIVSAFLKASGSSAAGAYTESTPKWTSDNTNIAAPGYDEILLKSGGKTTLQASVFGTTVSVPVTVTCKTHAWDNGTVTAKATCTEKGSKKFTCTKCGAEKTEEIKAAGHKPEELKAVAVTCTKDGKTAGEKCSVCGTILKEQKAIKALGHDYGNWTKVSASQHQRVCKRDSSHVEKESHQWNDGKVTKKATCTEKGTKEVTCTKCGEKKTEEIAAAGHKPATVKGVDATCTKDGKTAGEKCSVCDTILKEQKTIKALGHDYGSWTKLSDTQHQRVCKRDASHVEKESHHWDSGKVTKEATASAEGEKTYTCSDCGATKKEAVAKLPEESPKESETPKIDEAPKSEDPQTPSSVDPKNWQRTVDIPTDPTKASEETTTKADPGNTNSNDELAQLEVKISKLKGNNSLSGSNFRTLRLRSLKQTKKSIALKWEKVANATGYAIYGNRVGNSYAFKRLILGNSTTATTWIHKGLKAKTYYKYLIVAFRTVGTQRKVLSVSKTICVATKGGNPANVKGIKITNPKAKKKTLKKKKTVTIKAKELLSGKKLTRCRKLQYESSNSKVASVTAKGKVKAMKKGKCTIYVYSQTGTYATVKITVK